MDDTGSPNRHSRTSTFPLPFRVVVYPSDERPGYLTAHCLELDLVGEGRNLEGAVAELFENIAAQIEACEDNDARLYFPSPEWVGEKFLHAQRYGRKIPDEIIQRIVSKGTNDVDRIVATGEITEEHLLAHA